MQNLLDYLEGRLSDIEHKAKQGEIPGEIDTTELRELIGRQKELKRIIAVIEEMIKKD